MRMSEPLSDPHKEYLVMSRAWGYLLIGLLIVGCIIIGALFWG